LSTFIQQIEAALLPTATQYAPEGTEPKALAHQWMQALAYGLVSYNSNMQMQHIFDVYTSKYFFL